MVEEIPPKSKRKARGCLMRLLRLGVVLGLATVLASILLLLFVWVQYRHHVIQEPGAHLEIDHIQSIIVQDSPVYYRDAQTRIGVFFGDEHRDFLSFEEIPDEFKISIVAAEDGEFWHHKGVNLTGVARAMWSNVKAMRVVAGGSSITQQTAKNLYYRPDRSLKSKWTELVNGLRLEAHYQKSDILTFYSNQFHVHGNGRGLGIAARYFFDRDLGDGVESLSLVEAAFIAGLVKGPSLYDPFIGNEARRTRSLARAESRTRYVLQRIVDEPVENLVGPGSPEETLVELEARTRRIEGLKTEAATLLTIGFELPFRRGTFRYDSSAVLDEVKRRLSEPPFDRVLAEAGIDDPRRAGLVVVTTLDPKIQREATYGLWHHLSEVGTMLEKRSNDALVRAGAKGPFYNPYKIPQKHEFRTGMVTASNASKWPYSVNIDLGGHECVIDVKALQRVANVLKRGQEGRKSVVASRVDVKAIATLLSKESVVWVSVREVQKEGPAMCDLEIRPELQGAATVVENGELRAMVGGNDNRNFNRSMALRQMGSTWKPLLFHAAIELGWRPDDSLDNTRNVFPFSTTYYYPRPDHEPDSEVSLAWAGVHSENLASIWLLFHLMDNLDGEEIRVLASKLDLARREGEPIKAYRRRIQKAGVLPTRSRLKQQQFLMARHEVQRSLDEMGFGDDKLALTSLVYGWGYSKEIDRIRLEGGKDAGWKLHALTNSWLAMSARIEPCSRQYAALTTSIQAGIVPPRGLVSDLGVLLDGLEMRVACGALPDGFVPIDGEALAPLLKKEPPPTIKPPEKGLSKFKQWLGLGKPAVQEEAHPSLPSLVASDQVLVEERLRLGTLEAVQAALFRRQLVSDAAAGSTDLYDPSILYWHQDFRVLLAMRYISEMAYQYGARSPIPPVLAMPLGASEITLEEAAAIYDGIVTGERWSFPGTVPGPGGLGGATVGSPPSPTLLISELRDVDGNVIYRANPTSERVGHVETAAMTADILRNVVQHGTGRRAARAVTEQGFPIPVGGKTGTTNEYRNAAFLGFVPAATEDGYDPQEGYIVGVYVGYDDNRPMVQKRIRVAGSNGALPSWIAIAKGLQENGFLGQPPLVEPLETGVSWESVMPGGIVAVPVDKNAGGLRIIEVPDGSATDATDTFVWVPRPNPTAELVFQVLFEPKEHPIRIAPRTDSRKPSIMPELEPESIWER